MGLGSRSRSILILISTLVGGLQGKSEGDPRTMQQGDRIPAGTHEVEHFFFFFTCTPFVAACY